MKAKKVLPALAGVVLALPMLVGCHSRPWVNTPTDGALQPQPCQHYNRDGHGFNVC